MSKYASDGPMKILAKSLCISW